MASCTFFEIVCKRADGLSFPQRRLPALTTEEGLDPSRVCERRKDHKSEEVWAMCGKFCSVKMVRGL